VHAPMQEVDLAQAGVNSGCVAGFRSVVGCQVRECLAIDRSLWVVYILDPVLSTRCFATVTGDSRPDLNGIANQIELVISAPRERWTLDTAPGREAFLEGVESGAVKLDSTFRYFVVWAEHLVRCLPFLRLGPEAIENVLRCVVSR
jgi:hypothetical protein